MTTSRTTSPTLLDALDQAIVGMRRVFERPGYRERLFGALDHELDLPTLRLLWAVARVGSPPSIGELATSMMVSPSSASRFVDRGVATGLLDRRSDPNDRRRAVVALLPAGREVLDRAMAARRDLLAEAAKDWSADELRQLVSLLARLQTGFDELEA